MGKDPVKGAGKGSAARPVARRAHRYMRPRAEWIVKRLMRAPNFGWAVTISVLFVAVCGTIGMWARSQPLVAVGRVVDFTALVRVGFRLEDADATAQARESERLRTPRVYVALPATLEEIEASLLNLPRTLAGVEDVSSVAEGIRAQFQLTAESLRAVQRELDGDGPSSVWRGRVHRLLEELRQRPMLESHVWQTERQEGLNAMIELRLAPGQSRQVMRDNAISIGDTAQLTETASRVAAIVGFEGPQRQVVVSRLTTSPKPTYRFDQELTAQRQAARADAVAPIIKEKSVGMVLFRRGDRLEPAQYEEYKAELSHFQREAEAYRVWLRNMSIVAATAAVALGIAGYVALFCPRVRRNPGRMAGIALLLTAGLAVASVGTVWSPGLRYLTAIAPTVFVAVILVIAYDRRVAMALGVLHALLVSIALDQKIGVFALMLTGIGVAVWRLPEIRDRRTLVRMGLGTGLALALGAALVALVDRPITPAMLREIVLDASFAGAGGVLVGVITLAMLPTIERTFGITTGMTLIELRDPKQPLLRQLQQNAPGTYNHSLNVASIAESAAETIGADGLLTYVGALYHDIGKMNKPEYFVENQSGGPNRHDKLSPAMSVLVIVGHVKDGMAIAREHGLPKSLQHFIEAHHGTTLVEFFYERAKRQARESEGAEDATPSPSEVEYRYPGPRPATKEVAIVMLADAVESATRTMSDPTPSRIDALVRALANKRLMDGQFDECNLTLRELQAVCESISKTLASIYHGRIVYQSTASVSGEKPPEGEARAS